MKFRKVLAVSMAAAMSLALFTGMSSSAKNVSKMAAGENTPKTINFLSIWAANTDGGQLVMDLSKQYEKTHKNFKVSFEMVASPDLTQKINTLMAADSLPDVFAYESGAPLKTLITAGKVVNIETASKALGVYSQLQPGSVSLLKTLVDGKGLYDIPLGMNVEGFWYNIAMFKKNNISVPKTWDDLIKDCKVLKSKNIVPIAVGAKDQWPATRLVNAYLIRSLGVNAMANIASGKAKMTDPKYVAAVTQIQNMEKAGYFGSGSVTVDLATAVSMVLSAKAGMIYDGSWITQDLTDKTKNKLGSNGVGFFNIPTVKGGAGKATDFSVNCGNTLVLSKKNYDATTGAWLKYMMNNLGNYAMSKQGRYIGFKVTKTPANVSPYTKLVGKELGLVKGSALWFEARMDTKPSSVAQTNIQSVLINSMTPTQYCQSIQSALS
jgi:ABC-type sugar transport system, periplasmic component